MPSKEQMFCLVFSRNVRQVDKFENSNGETVTGHLLELGADSKYDAIIVLIRDANTQGEVLACKQLRIDEHPNKHLKVATETLYEMAKEHDLVQQVPF